MLIAISSLGRKTTDLLSFRFARSPYFVFLSSSGLIKDILVVEKEYWEKRKSIEIARQVARFAPQALITGQIDENAFHILKEANIKVFTAPKEMLVSKAFAAWQKGELEEISAANWAGAWGKGADRELGKPFGGDKGDARFGFNFQKKPLGK